MKLKTVKVNRRVLSTVVSAVVIIAGTILAIAYAQGKYRITDEGFLPGTGLLAANSFPPVAEVYVNDKLVTVTDDTLYLQPGQYKVQITKDGYTPWQKDLIIKETLVTQTNAKLFPMSPSLTALTFTGLQNISPSPDGQRVIYYTASASAERKNGLYVYDLTTSSLPFSNSSGPRQIAEDAGGFDLANARFIWSPDSSEVLLVAGDRQVLLNLEEMNQLGSLQDVSFRSREILAEWEEEMYIREREYLAQFPPAIIGIATASAKNVYISPDKKRLLYTASSAATIPDGLVPAVPSINTTAQERTLQPEGIYVYDREEDTNFRIGTAKSDSTEPVKKLLTTDLFVENPQSSPLLATASAFRSLQASTSAETADNFNLYHTSLFADTFQWYPDSKHLLYTQDQTVNVMSYDGTNKTVLYSGPFREGFVYPWPDGSRVLIATNFSSVGPYNLYAIELE